MGRTKPTLDRVFSLLSERRRRYVFYFLDEEDTDAVVALDDIADQVVAWERDWDGRTGQSLDEHRESVRLDLHHNHLPKLAETGLVDYDARTTTVRYWEDVSFEDWVDDDHPEKDHLRALL